MSVLKVNESDFDAVVKSSKEPVLVDFYADWCGPCKALSPTLESISEDFSEKAKVVKVNVDDNPDLAREYGIRGIPALVFFKDGKIVQQLSGNQPKENLTEVLNKFTQ